MSGHLAADTTHVASPRVSGARPRAGRPSITTAVLAALAFLLVAVAHLVMVGDGADPHATVPVALRAVGTTLALGSGVLKLASWLGTPRASTLIVGVALVGVGLLETARLVALLFYVAGDVQALRGLAVPLGWAASTSLPLLLLLGMALVPAGRNRTRRSRRRAFLAIAAAVVAFAVAGASTGSLPVVIDPGQVVDRPAAAWTVALYLVTFAFLWRRRDVSASVDGRWLAFALYLGFLDQTLVAPFWDGVGTRAGTVDAALAAVVYLIVTGGVLLGVTRVVRAQRDAVVRSREEAHERGRVERALARQAARLTHANEELAQYAYLASHDLQEPLRMVSNYLQLIERRYADTLDDDGREFIGYAVDGARRMKNLTNDLLKYSRLGDEVAEGERADAGEAVGAAVRNLEVLITETGAEVEYGPLPVVAIDGVRLTQLFQNLIGNAIKFRREGIPPRVRVEATREGGTWRFSVADNGIGIDPKYHQRVFGVFQRLHGRDTYPGSGIGLAMCRKIVERHGGTIRIESPPGEGTTVVFTLPADAAARPARDRSLSEEDPELRRRVTGLIERARELI